MPPYKTQGIVLRTYDLGEADKILVLFTRNEGKISAIAKGAKKPRSRSLGGAQMFGHNQYLLYRGRNLDIVTQYEVVSAHVHLRDDLERLAYASYAVELLIETTHERDPSPEIFDLMVWILGNIDSGRNNEAAIAVYELRLMEHLGYRPELSRCASCGEEVTGRCWFDAGAGGIVCSACSPGMSQARPLSLGAAASLRALQDPASRWQALKLSGEVGAEVASALEEYIIYRTEKRLVSLEFLKSLKQSK